MIAKAIRILIAIAVVGLVVWALLALVPMPGPLPTIIEVVAVLIVLLVIAREFGVAA